MESNIRLRVLLRDIQKVLPPESTDLHQRIRLSLTDLEETELNGTYQADTQVSEAPNEPQQAESLKSQATKAFKDNDFPLALHLCDQAVGIEPLECTHFANRSLAHLRLRHFEKATADAEAAIKLKPEWGKAHFRLGAALLAHAENSLHVSDESPVEKLVQARNAFKTALKHDPSNTLAAKSLEAVLRHQQTATSAAPPAAATTAPGAGASSAVAPPTTVAAGVTTAQPAAIAGGGGGAPSSPPPPPPSPPSRSRSTDSSAAALEAEAAKPSRLVEYAAQAQKRKEQQKLRAEKAMAELVDVEVELEAAKSHLKSTVAASTSKAPPVPAPASSSSPAPEGGGGSGAPPAAATALSSLGPAPAPSLAPFDVPPRPAESSAGGGGESSAAVGGCETIDGALQPPAPAPSPAPTTAPVPTTTTPPASAPKKKKGKQNKQKEGTTAAPTAPAPAAATVTAPPAPLAAPGQAAAAATGQAAAAGVGGTPERVGGGSGGGTCGGGGGGDDDAEAFNPALPRLGSPLEPLMIVPAIQDCLRRAARGGTSGGPYGLTDDYVAARFRGLDQELLVVSRQLLGSAVQHADNETGDLPAKVLSNMYRFVNLTLRRRAQKKAGQEPAAGADAESGGGGGSASGGCGSIKSSSGSIEHTPVFLRDSLVPSSSSSSSSSPSSAQAVVVTEVRDVAEGQDGAQVLVPSAEGAAVVVTPALPPAPTTTPAEPSNQKKGHKSGSSSKKKGKSAAAAAVVDQTKNQNRRIGEAAKKAAAALEAHGCAVVDQFLSLDLVTRVREEISKLEPHYKNSEIWVGKDSDVGAQITVPRVRGDKVLWVDRGSINSSSSMSAVKELMEAMDRLVLTEMSSRCGRLERLKDRTDPMLAIYPGKGSRFQKHIDNTARDGRRLTVLCYLNTSWGTEDGGHLRVHSSEEETKNQNHSVAYDVSPHAGRLAMFFADSMPHEVMPAHADRHSVTVWYYDAQERKEALAKAPKPASKPTPGSASASSLSSSTQDGEEEAAAHIKSRHEARAFLLWILGSDKVATQAQVEAITQRALKLSPNAVRIVAGVVGAPSPEDAMEALGRLTPDTLQKLRADLNEMGIGGA